nr:5120_t:CDS:2 [Entrophospora candida]
MDRLFKQFFHIRVTANSSSHFIDVNILGTDHLKANNTKLFVNSENDHIYTSFGTVTNNGNSQPGLGRLAGIVAGIVGYCILDIVLF